MDGIAAAMRKVGRGAGQAQEQLATIFPVRGFHSFSDIMTRPICLIGFTRRAMR